MPVQIQKEKAKQDQLTATKSTLSAEEQKMVDRMQAIHEVLAPLEPLQKEFDELKKTLASVAADKERFDPEQPAVLKGFKGVVKFSAVTHKREIENMHGLIGSLKTKVGGYDNLLPLIKVTLGDCGKVLTPAELAAFTKTVDGPRKLEDVRSKDE